jgi:hypothetical protein
MIAAASSRLRFSTLVARCDGRRLSMQYALRSSRFSLSTRSSSCQASSSSWRKRLCPASLRWQRAAMEKAARASVQRARLPHRPEPRCGLHVLRDRELFITPSCTTMPDDRNEYLCLRLTARKREVPWAPRLRETNGVAGQTPRATRTDRA